VDGDVGAAVGDPVGSGHGMEHVQQPPMNDTSSPGGQHIGTPPITVVAVGQASLPDRH
jgi:hypothetical protein